MIKTGALARVQSSISLTQLLEGESQLLGGESQLLGGECQGEESEETRC